MGIIEGVLIMFFFIQVNCLHVGSAFFCEVGLLMQAKLGFENPSGKVLNVILGLIEKLVVFQRKIWEEC